MFFGFMFVCSLVLDQSERRGPRVERTSRIAAVASASACKFQDSQLPRLKSSQGSPFRLLAQPISGAVRTPWPGSSRFNPRGRHSSSRTRTIEKRFLGLFECSDRLLPGNRWEIFQEIAERLSGLEIVDQRLERHTCADEHGRPAHDFGIAVDDGLRVHDEAILPAEGGRPPRFAFREAGTRKHYPRRTQERLQPQAIHRLSE